MAFQVAFVRRDGEAFQAFFVDIMSRRYPDDFRPVRPWSTDGDRKNDGYLPSQRQLFQVYAPSAYRASELTTKMQADWQGAIEHWEPYFDRWTFVHNDVSGLAPAVELTLQALNEAHDKVTCDAWGEARLREVTFQLSEDHLTDLFGPPVTAAAMASIGFEELQPLMEHLGALEPVPDSEVRPVPADKADINVLSDSTRELLRVGMRKSPLLGRYFSGQRATPDKRDRVAARFREKYEQLRDKDHNPDTIFGELCTWIIGSQHHPTRYASALAVLAYFFEECDIFEEVPRVTDS